MTQAQLRELLAKRAGNLCEYCHANPLTEYWPYHVEHVIATAHGGSDDFDNLAYACRRCNEFKGPNLATIDPVTGELVPLFNPRRQDWNTHFRMDGPIVVGITPTGRGTVQLLKMNEDNRIEVRSRTL